MLDPRPGGIPNQEWVVVPDESDLPAAGNYDQPHVSIKARQRRDDLARRTSTRLRRLPRRPLVRTLFLGTRASRKDSDKCRLEQCNRI